MALMISGIVLTLVGGVLLYLAGVASGAAVGIVTGVFVLANAVAAVAVKNKDGKE
jgi:hypothetical protein